MPDPDYTQILSDETVIYTPGKKESSARTDNMEIPQTFLIGYETAGHRIDGIIGVGGFGVVYQATDLALNRTVALKEYFPHTLSKRNKDGNVELKNEKDRETFQAGLSSFINEARLLAKFDHSSLVKVYRFWESHQTAYMTMSFVPGSTLKSRIEAATQDVSEQSLKSILTELAQALAVMHEYQCYHRDVSPDNVIMHAETGSPVLLDFGAARQAIQSQVQSFTVILKSGYAPVEQYSEIPTLSQGPWTDIYALGALAYRVLTGHPPPSAVGRMVNDSAIKLAQSDSLSNYSTTFLETIDAALAVMPEDRIQTMQDFIDLLNAHTNTRPEINKAPRHHSAHPETATAQRRVLSSKVFWGSMATLAISSALLTFYGLKTPNTTPEPVAKSENATSSITPTSPERLINAIQDKVTLSSNKNNLIINKDLLQLTIQSTRAGYLSLFVETSDGLLLQMLPAGDSTRYIQANESISFPSADAPLIAAGPPGDNKFMAIVTKNPIPELSFPKQPYFGFSKISWSGSDLLLKLENQLNRSLNCDQKDCSQDLIVSQLTIRESY